MVLKNNLNNNININNKNINFIKLMKTVNDYKNKAINKQRYDNYVDKNSIAQKKQIKFSYNPEFSNINMKNSSEKKVIQNINQNALTMYSIYIISYYFTDFNKICLYLVLVLDKNKKSIPVICSNNNCGKDSNKLFLISNNNNVKKPFITDFKKNIYINFYIHNSHINDIKYIQITNYLDIKNRISPVGKIEIYQGKKLIFKGILNSNKISNIEIIKSKKNENDNYDNQEIIQDLDDMNGIIEIDNNNYINNRPYSLSRYRSIEEDNMNLNKNKLEMNNEYDNYYTTRVEAGKQYNNLIKNYSNDKLPFNNNTNQIYNMDNIEITDLDNDNDNENNISNNNDIKNNMNINLDNLFSQKLSYEFGKSSKLNKIILSSPKNTNEKFETYNSNNSNNNSINKINNSNSNKNLNRINKENVTLNNNNKDINHAFFNLFRKTYNKNDIGDMNMNDIFRTSVNKLKDYSAFNLKNNIDSNNHNKNNTDFLDYNIDNINNDSFNDLNISNDNINNNNNLYNSVESPNYIEFNKIRFVISSNYGHSKYVGLTGIELFNVKSEQINIETALTIGALPKDLRTLYNDEKDQRIFENVFNKIFCFLIKGKRWAHNIYYFPMIFFVF